MFGILSVLFRGGKIRWERRGGLIGRMDWPLRKVSRSAASSDETMKDLGMSRPGPWKKRLGLANGSNICPGVSNRSGRLSCKLYKCDPSGGRGGDTALPFFLVLLVPLLMRWSGRNIVQL